jgi:hypothetical protein
MSDEIPDDVFDEMRRDESVMPNMQAGDPAVKKVIHNGPSTPSQSTGKPLGVNQMAEVIATANAYTERLRGRFAHRCKLLARELHKVGSAAAISERLDGSQTWEVADRDEDGNYTGMIYRVTVERSRWVEDIVGKKPWEVS